MEIEVVSGKNGTQMKHDETAFHNLPEGFAPLAVEVRSLSLLSILEDPGPFQQLELHKARRCVYGLLMLVSMLDCVGLQYVCTFPNFVLYLGLQS